MRNIGIDIGSRTVKMVGIDQSKVVFARKAENSYDALGVCRELLSGLEYETMIATGYGRHLFSEHYKCQVISEIKAFATGARVLFPNCQSILDIGGQDTKAISLDESGKVLKFEMNDRCAAGTGRFMEIMATALGYSSSEFGEAALLAKKAEKISSICTVFAESEVISLLTRGAHREEVAMGIHESISRRILGMLGRVPLSSELVFAGGVANNQCIRHLLAENLGIPISIPPDPQIVGALGAAIEGIDNENLRVARSLTLNNFPALS